MPGVERHIEWRVVALLAAVVTATLLLASPDSYLHDLYNRVDSAWFYLCGKAWFSGMTPYVDFTDSKGPLLWLIYGVAYLLSPRDYTGVYWLTCVSFPDTLWLIFRAARVVLPSRRLALLVSLLMPAAYFYPYIHEEVKVEHFAQPLIALCLYGTLLLRHGRNLRCFTPVRVLVATGAAMGCALMMKYSFVPMLAVFAIYSAHYARRHGCRLVHSLRWLAAGVTIAVLPWLLWMLAVGNLEAFVHQYFVNTLGTLGGLRDQHGTLLDILRKLRLHHVVTLFPLLCVGGAVLMHYAQRTLHNAAPRDDVSASSSAAWRIAHGALSFPVVATVWFFVCTLPNAWWIYYYEICTWTLFFGITAVVLLLGRHWCVPSRTAVAAVAVTVVTAVGAWNVLLAPANFFTVSHPAREAYYRYAYLMRQVERPTVVYWDIYSCGFETPADGLPGTLYWAGQNGATPSMSAAQEQAVRDGNIDFVFVADTLHDARLREWGYRKWDYSQRDDIQGCDDLLYTLYTRHILQPPPAEVAPRTPIEIVTRHWKPLDNAQQ